MIILGIDPGTARIGYALLDKKEDAKVGLSEEEKMPCKYFPRKFPESQAERTKGLRNQRGAQNTSPVGRRA